MTPEPRVTAYWYSASRGLPCDLESLRELGLQARRRARWLGLEPVIVAEGPYQVHAWPEDLWDEITDAFRDYDDGVQVISRDYGWGEGSVPWDGDDIRPG